MSKEYPYPCCRCGFCCLSETCPIGQIRYKIEKWQPCPGLSFDEATGNAVCALAGIFKTGVGDGCCIKARCFKDGVAYDFAGLPPDVKRSIGQAAKEAKGL